MSTAKQISRASGSAGEPARESERRSESARLVGGRDRFTRKGAVQERAVGRTGGDGDARTRGRTNLLNNHNHNHNSLKITITITITKINDYT